MTAGGSHRHDTPAPRRRAGLAYRPSRRSRTSPSRLSFRSARSAVAIGLSAKVAKPQSVVSRTRSRPRCRTARGACQCLVDRLEFLALLVHDADRYPLIVTQAGKGIQVPGSRCAELQQERLHVQRREQWN